MKIINIIGYYTTPDYDLKMSNKLYHLLRQTIENEILAKFTFPKIKSSILEIFIDTEVKSDERKVIQLSKTGRGEYFTFRFFLPYNIVVKNRKLKIKEFISEFMECIRTAFSQFNVVSDELIDKLKENLIVETSDNKEYEHIKSANELSRERVLKNFRKMRKKEELEKI